MKFVKEYVPDKRWQIGQRPVIVDSNLFLWIVWKFIIGIENLSHNFRVIIEKSFKIVDNIKEENE